MILRTTIIIAAEIIILAISLLIGGFLVTSAAVDAFIEGLLDD